MNELILDGCAPFPLASYLKALGLLRLVAEQVDPQARGAWDRERFLLSSRLDADGLVHFLLHDYRPTPVLNPWNGGSGFNEGPGDTSARDYVAALEDSHSPRFEAFRRSISAARRARERLGLIEKPDVEQKARLIALCRATFPEEALPWLDTALVLTPEKAEFPPLLGTGGNDGRLDFSVTQMKRLSKLFTTADGTPDKQAEGLLRAALFGLTVSGVPGDGIGQFSPQCAGGANASTGFDGGSQANPWDFVLALEGAMLLTASASRRLQDQESSHLSAPFNVRPVSGGYASAGPEDPDMSRAETWLPLWNRSASLAELRQLFSEGRARVGTHLAGNSLDFARAVAGLGVDRGLTEFQRIGFQERNGRPIWPSRWAASRWPATPRPPWSTAWIGMAGCKTWAAARSAISRPPSGAGSTSCTGPSSTCVGSPAAPPSRRSWSPWGPCTGASPCCRSRIPGSTPGPAPPWTRAGRGRPTTARRSSTPLLPWRVWRSPTHKEPARPCAGSSTPRKPPAVVRAGCRNARTKSCAPPTISSRSPEPPWRDCWSCSS